MTGPTLYSSKQVAWVATDIDGTFLDADHRISPTTIETYRELKRKNIRIVPATGRTPRAVRRVAEASDHDFAHKEFDMFPGIYANGALVLGENEQDVIHAREMSPDILVLFCAVCYKWQEHQEELTGSKPPLTMMASHTTGLLLDFAEGIWPEYERDVSEEPGTPINQKFDNVEMLKPFKFLIATALTTPDRIPNLLQFIDSQTDFVQQADTAGLQTISSFQYIVNALPKSENKAEGMKRLFARYPQMAENSWLFIGDGLNDCELLSYAPKSVAMGHACDTVKKAAHFVTLGPDEEGWSHAMKTHVI